MSNFSILPELLEKYVSGQCTAEEALRVEAWYAAQKGDKDYLSTLSDLERQLLEEDTLKNIRSKMNIGVDNPNEWTPKKRLFGQKRKVWMGLAASFLLLFSVGWYFWQSSQSTQSAATLFDDVEPIKTAETVQFVNKEARLVMYQLPDGTQVCLHPNAELTYPKVFGAKSRQVTFIGEGFFDVAHDSLHPFLIQSDKMQVRVLGTKFNIKALPKQAIFQVSVVSGRVAVRSMSDKGKVNAETVILKPQQKALFDVATNHLTSVEVAPQIKKEIYEPISITFEDTPIQEVTCQLERQFNIHIQLSENALSKCLLTADFNHKPLPVILELMCASLDATYSLSGDTLILKGIGCE